MFSQATNQLRLPGDCKFFAFKCSVNVTTKKPKKTDAVKRTCRNFNSFKLSKFQLPAVFNVYEWQYWIYSGLRPSKKILSTINKNIQRNCNAGVSNVIKITYHQR